jgi:hypothetical protein
MTLQRRIPAQLAALLAVLCFAVSLSAQAPEWRQYTYADDGISFSAPLPPTAMNQAYDTDAGKADTHFHYVESADFIIVFATSHYEKSVNKPVHQILEDSCAGTSKGGKVISHRDLTLDGVPGMETEYTLEGKHCIVRFYHRNGVSYVIMKRSPEANPQMETTNRYLNSFHILSPAR